jgi:signal transduction histidine kinase
VNARNDLETKPTEPHAPAAPVAPAPPSTPSAAQPRPGPDAAALAEFFGSLAHDLRSPLGVVSEALAELRTEFAASFTDEHRLLVNLADRGVRRLGRIADTVSLLAALDSGTFEIRPRPIDLFEILREAMATASAIEPRREVAVVSEVPEGPCAGLGDSDRLSRALVEIVINAVRHARRKARIAVELSPGVARVIVEDDGQGVAPAFRANLFRRFMPRPSRSGLGMGLSIAHDVIVAHGGQLTLEASELPAGRPGTTGARFVITLPLDGARIPARVEAT